jgi:neopullulanase
MNWTRHAVIYNIFVDRFARGRSDNNQVGNLVPWGSAPSREGFMGGDLRGIIERLDYLQDFGVNALCLTPIFMSSSNHRYNTYDYYQIDPRIGRLEDFRRLVEQAHQRDIRLILDGVFNHCGRGFYPFFDVMENGADSHYRDWFSIDGFPVDAYGRHRYRACLNAALMPEFNLANLSCADIC